MKIKHWNRIGYESVPDGMYDLNDFEKLYDSYFDSSTRVNESDFYFLTQRAKGFEFYKAYTDQYHWFAYGKRKHLIILSGNGDDDRGLHSCYIRKDYAEELTIQIFKELALS